MANSNRMSLLDMKTFIFFKNDVFFFEIIFRRIFHMNEKLTKRDYPKAFSISKI